MVLARGKGPAVHGDCFAAGVLGVHARGEQGLGDRNVVGPCWSNRATVGVGPCAVGLGLLDQLRGLQVGWA